MRMSKMMHDEDYRHEFLQLIIVTPSRLSPRVSNLSRLDVVNMIRDDISSSSLRNGTQLEEETCSHLFYSCNFEGRYRESLLDVMICITNQLACLEIGSISMVKTI